MRADTQLHALPMIVLTALVLPGDHERYRAAGADAYLTKPISFPILLAMIAAHVRSATRTAGEGFL